MVRVASRREVQGRQLEADPRVGTVDINTHRTRAAQRKESNVMAVENGTTLNTAAAALRLRQNKMIIAEVKVIAVKVIAAAEVLVEVVVAAEVVVATMFTRLSTKKKKTCTSTST